MSIGILRELFIIYIFYCSHISTKLIMNKRIFAFRIGSFSLIKQTKIPFKILSILCLLSFISFTSFYSLPSSLSLVFLFLKFSQVEVFQKELWLYEVLFSSDLLTLANTQKLFRTPHYIKYLFGVFLNLQVLINNDDLLFPKVQEESKDSLLFYSLLFNQNIYFQIRFLFGVSYTYWLLCRKYFYGNI